jgi:hypothetical protein
VEKAILAFFHLAGDAKAEVLHRQQPPRRAAVGVMDAYPRSKPSLHGTAKADD